MGQHNYNSKDVTITYKGQIITGYVNGSRVDIAYNNDAYTFQQGSDNDNTRSATNDYSAQVTIHLNQESLSNKVFSDAVNADKLNDSGIGELTISHKSGMNFSDPNATVMKFGDIGRNQDAGPTDWVLYCPDLDGKNDGDQPAPPPPPPA